MSDVEVPYEDALETRLEDEQVPDATDKPLDLEAPEADVVEQQLEVDLDDDDYR